MKKLMKLSLLLVVVALTFSSCNCFKKMAKNSDDVSLTYPFFTGKQKLVDTGGRVAKFNKKFGLDK